MRTIDINYVEMVFLSVIMFGTVTIWWHLANLVAHVSGSN